MLLGTTDPKLVLITIIFRLVSKVFWLKILIIAPLNALISISI